MKWPIRAGVGQIEEDRRLEAFAPERAPEALDLPQRLRMPRPGHNMLDAALPGLLMKRTFATPRDILRAVVGEHFRRRSVGRDFRPKDFEHQRGGLTGLEPKTDEKTAVVVEEGDQIDPPVLAFEHEGEEVGLPELVGPSAFEAPRVVGVRPSGRLMELVTRLVQDACNGYGARRQSRAPEQHVADPLAPPVGLRLLERQNGPASGIGKPASRLAPRGWSRNPAVPSRSNRCFQA